MLRIFNNRDDNWAFMSKTGLAVHTGVQVKDVTKINPVQVLNDIHDWINALKPESFVRDIIVRGHIPRQRVKQFWTSQIDTLVENKGHVVIEPTTNMTLPYSFVEIEEFFADKPGLFVKDDDEVTATTRDITVTPWKPCEGLPILIKLPHVMADAAVSKFVRMFIVPPIEEVRWQRGHVKTSMATLYEHPANVMGFAAWVGHGCEPMVFGDGRVAIDGYDGNGHYVY
jgi:hypothetical protein